MPRLRRSDCRGDGIGRRRRGRGFSYTWTDGRRVDDDEVLARIRALAVPPAWVDVWICPWANGHIQATGTDAAGRRQYRYHDAWHASRGRAKFARVLTFAQVLPDLRSAVARDLATGGLTRERVLAAAVRLLDVGCFRIGGEAYAEEHETFGVATLERRHVTVREGVLVFDYPAKGSLRRIVAVDDPPARDVVVALKRRRSRRPHLFAYRRDGRWVEVRSDDVNAYIKEVAGEEFSAKDFRTWSATLVAAAALGTVEGADTTAARRKAVTAALARVAEQLGNTPAVCRSSYVDPRVIDRFHTGETVGETLRALGEPDRVLTLPDREELERAVVALLGDGQEAA